VFCYVVEVRRWATQDGEMVNGQHAAVRRDPVVNAIEQLGLAAGGNCFTPDYVDRFATCPWRSARRRSGIASSWAR
jgi:hypothetical protein